MAGNKPLINTTPHVLNHNPIANPQIRAPFQFPKHIAGFWRDKETGNPFSVELEEPRAKLKKRKIGEATMTLLVPAGMT